LSTLQIDPKDFFVVSVTSEVVSNKEQGSVKEKQKIKGSSRVNVIFIFPSSF